MANRHEENERLLAGIRSWVEIESPSTDAEAVNRMADLVQGELDGIGLETERVSGRDGFGDHLLARTPWQTNEPGIMVLGHLDTVWSLGTLAARPFRVEDGKAYGPGIYDMKGGAYLICEAIRTIMETEERPPLPITVLFVSDEEVGSPTSREVIEAEARRSKYVIVNEPARPPHGAAVTTRSGWGRFRIRVRGRAAHAGSDHQLGRSAVAELARLIVKIEGMTDYERGVTFNVGTVQGGTRPNMVPEEAEADVDLRFANPDEADSLEQAVLGLEPEGEDIEIEVFGGINRPPFERSEAGMALFERAKAVAADAGVDLKETWAGGVSDGNFAAALGVPTLDGLGVVGAGAHAEHEHIVVDRLAERSDFLLGLLRTLD
ncbi:MAG: glutamate carboxypeptidase [Alphaproteobacteria bacterium]|nr:glutamate carboxypeptidase [Alphaproteobacteria bacterium]